jgi:molecular chaperone GrpE
MSDSPENDAQDPGEDGPRIAASPEMEEALREAEQSFEERKGGDPPARDESASSADKMTIELLSKELQELKALHEEKLAELEERQDQQVRLQAEFENFRRRGLKEKQESLRFGHQNLVQNPAFQVLNGLDR